jgi:cysteine-rich repeat protein
MIRKRLITGASLIFAALALAPSAHGIDVTGTVQLQGQVVFAAPVPGIIETDLEVSVKESTETTGNGEQCEILATTSDNPDGAGIYPDAGTVSVQITIGRGGMMMPEGECIITVRARGTDGASVSAQGSQTLFLTVADIGGNATVAVPTITVRQSKAVAGVVNDCLKWSKKQLIKRAKCNFLLLKKGPAAATKCKDAGPEPIGCDPGDFVEAILAFSHDSNDQQTDPMNAEGVDYDVLRDQVLCQKRLGKAAAKFVAKRNKLVQTKCIAQSLDSEDCRSDQSRDARPKLDQIDKCTGDQMTDGGTGRIVPDVAAPCDTCIDMLGQIDRKCLKGCFQLALDELSDGIVGDLPECGDGILHTGGGEFCDDGNTTNGDCCSSACAIEAGSPEGPMGNPTCMDALDNDCDTLVDGADPDCL